MSLSVLTLYSAESRVISTALSVFNSVLHSFLNMSELDVGSWRRSGKEFSE